MSYRPAILKGVGLSILIGGVGLSSWLVFKPVLQTQERSMGYSTGKGCFEGECGNKPTLTDCVNCCSVRCQQWVSDCVDECANKFDPADVFREVSEAGTIVGNRDAKDYVKFSRSVNLLKAAQRSKDPRLARVARLIAQEASDKSGLAIASMQ